MIVEKIYYTFVNDGVSIDISAEDLTKAIEVVASENEKVRSILFSKPDLYHREPTIIERYKLFPKQLIHHLDKMIEVKLISVIRDKRIDNILNGDPKHINR